MSNIKYTYYIEQAKDRDGNYIQSFSIYKTPVIKTIKLKTFKKLSDASDFLEKYESN
jgi:hypothetical protein